ncbi:MAG: OmpA family protein [Hyphomicrobiaceae bacterium]|jgi:outer membrane protein OmpA-like peptidoglycan-associated protein
MALISRYAARYAGALALASGLALSPALAQAPTPPPAPPPTPIAFEQALLNAANTLFSKANLPIGGDRVPLIIEPLIDGFTGAQSITSRSMERRISDLVRSDYRRFELLPFTTQSLDKQPVVLIGTFTAINNAGVAGGPRDAYRICLALADLKDKRIISKGATRALPEGIDPTPTSFFDDSPAFVKDPATDGLIRSCQASKLGEPLDPAYSDRMRVSVLVNDGIEAYNAGKFNDALNHYESAWRAPGGDQLRVLNGLYLANWKLGRRDAARDAFDRVVDYGLNAERMAVKFLFRPNAAQFTTDKGVRPQYDMWVAEIARRATSADKCLEVSGHTSATGAADLNEKLSLQRAEYVRDRLNEVAGKTAKRFAPVGVGPRQLIVGTGRDDSSDALDRRVEFKTIPCAGITASSDKVVPAKASPDKPVSKAASKRPDGGEPEKASEPAPKPKAAKRTASPKRYVDEDGNVRSQQVPGEVRRQLRKYGIDID